MKLRTKGIRKLFGFLKKESKAPDADGDSEKISGRVRLRCNICDRVFRATTKFHRFCKHCRAEDEIFQFSEWFRGGR